ncbi:terminase [Devosia sp. Root436]|nr:terminase [Devosia sp. Root436]
MVARQSLIAMEPLFPAEADAALAVFKSLRMVDVAGQPTFGEACEPFVFDFVRAVFGAYEAETGQRLIEEFFLLVSKKNGKSTIVAGIMLTALIRNWRDSQELLILAPTREVADNAFKPAADMVDADPDLVDLLHVNRNTKEITHRTKGAVLKVISADSKTASGKKAAFVLIDELWLFGKKANAAGMLQEATGGLISRPEGFVIYISTMSDAQPAGVFKEKLDYFRGVRDGEIEDARSLPVLYEFPPSMIASKAYLDPANFYVTNPNMGRSVRQSWLERKLAQVKAGQDEDGDTIQTFLAKHLNIEIGLNLRAGRWPGADHWLAAEDPELASVPHWAALERLKARCEVVVVGLDGGGLDDLLGMTVLGRETRQIEVAIEDELTGEIHRLKVKPWLAWSHGYCQRIVLQRRKSIATVLEDIAAARELTILNKPLGDVLAVTRIVEDLKNANLLGGVVVDPSGISEIIDAMENIGVTQEAGLLIGQQQGGYLMGAIKTTERYLASGQLKHAGGPLMQWCVPNLKIEQMATTIRATKATAGDAKIDPAISLFNAVAQMSRNPAAHRAKEYQMIIV